jgi:hypothetical protein
MEKDEIIRQFNENRIEHQHIMKHKSSKRKLQYQKIYSKSKAGLDSYNKYYNSKKRKQSSLKYSRNNKEKLRNNFLKYNYNISLLDYNNLFIKQGGLCLICLKPEIIKNKGKEKIKDLAVDHNHKTGKIRGLLCHKCNTAIGLMNENPLILDRAKEYLLK